MKNTKIENTRIGAIIWIASGLSLALYAACFPLSGLVNTPLVMTLLLSVHAVPAFFLQWGLVRVHRHRWLRWAPLTLLAALAVLGALYLTGILGDGWDALGGGIILCWCIAPAMGNCLGLMMDDRPAVRKGAFAALLVMEGIYLAVKALGGPVWYPDLTDLPAGLLLALGIALALAHRPLKNRSVPA